MRHFNLGRAGGREGGHEGRPYGGIYARAGAIVALAASAAGCNLDHTNPTAPTQATVLTSRAGVLQLAIGLQARLGAQTADFIYPGGLITDEIGAKTGALQAYRDAGGGTLDPTYDPVQTPWNSHYRTVATANDLLGAAPNVGLGDSTLSGVRALAYFAKAAAFGELLQQYKQIVLAPTATNNAYVDRPAALAAVRALLDSASAQLAAVAPGAEFTGSILAAGIDLPNSVAALQARYARLANDWPATIAAANRVSPAVYSRVPYSQTTPNPVSTGFSSYALPRDTLRAAAEAGDARPAYFEALTVTVAGDSGRVLHPFAQYGNPAASVPVYYPDEVRLVRAEAYANTGQLALAAADVNAVRTACAAGAATPQACLGPLTAAQAGSQAALLAQVYQQRKYALFATGLRWEDARRLASVGPRLIARRCWLLYPFSQRNADASTPADPESGSPPAAAVASCF